MTLYVAHPLNATGRAIKMPVRGDGKPIRWVDVNACQQERACVCFPPFDGLILRSRKDIASVGAEGHGMDGAHMPGEGAEIPAGGHLPEDRVFALRFEEHLTAR